MSLFKYIFFSSLEYFSTFVFILIQFRFSLRENATKILLISLVLSFVSYSFTSSDLGAVSPIVQIVIFLAFIHQVMKVSILNSVIMVFTGYIVYGLVQTCIIAVLSHVGVIEGALKPATNIAYQLQVYSCVLMLLLSYLTYYFKGGFSFIEARSRFSKSTFTGKNKWFVAFIAIALTITVLANIVILVSESPPYLLIGLVLMVALIILFYLSLRRDESVD